MRRQNEFEQSFITKMIGFPGRLWRSIMDRVGDDSIQTSRNPLQWAMLVLTFPFRFAYAVMVFMALAWSTSRNSYAFVRGLPALLVIAGYLAVIWAAFFFSNRRTRINQTRGRLAGYFQQNPDHPEYAEMFAERLVSLVPEEDDAKFQLGMARELCGKDVEARQIFNYLAPLEDINLNGVLDPGEDLNADGELSPGFPNAHVKLAQLYRIGKFIDIPEEQRLEFARHHYDLALKTEDNNILALLGNADILINAKDLEGATEYLERLVEGRITSLLQLTALPRLIQIRVELGQEDAAKRQMRSVINQFLSVARRNPNEFAIWATLVQCTTIVKDYKQSREIIEEAVQLATDEEVQKKLFGLFSQVWVSQADNFEDMENKEDYQKRLDALCRAVRTNPNNIAAFNRLLAFLVAVSEDQSFWLRDSIIGSTNPAVVHVMLGMYQIQDGNFVQGQEHWRIADQQMPRLTSIIINNLIDVSIASDVEVLENTKDMLAVAIDLFPRDQKLKITQGIYFSRHDRIEEAIAILEPSLETLPNFVRARQALIDCYHMLGNAEKAKIHEDAMKVTIEGLTASERKLVEDYLMNRKK